MNYFASIKNTLSDLDPPAITTTSIPRDDNSDFASLITQIPIVTSPKPAPNQQPITLSPGARTTVSDPKLPPIPTFSPKDLRKQRIQDHRLRGKKFYIL